MRGHLQRLQRPSLQAAARAQARPKTLASQDESPQRSLDEEEVVMQQLEVEEPLVEERAESAAATVIAAMMFGAGVWALQGDQKGAEFFAGYLLEQSLSGGKRTTRQQQERAGAKPARLHCPRFWPLCGGAWHP